MNGRDGRAEVAQQLHAGLERVGGRAQVGVDDAVVGRVRGGEAGELAAASSRTSRSPRSRRRSRCRGRPGTWWPSGRRCRRRTRTAGSGTASRWCCRRSAGRRCRGPRPRPPRCRGRRPSGCRSSRRRRPWCSSCTSERQFSGSSGFSTKETVMPILGSEWCSRLYVPPYSEAEATTWSPASARLRIASVSAAWPLDTASAATPPSSDGHALLQRVLRRVHDPGVDVAELGQREEVRGVLAVAELVAGGRRRSAARGRRWWGRGSCRRGSAGSRSSSSAGRACAGLLS